MAAVVVEGDPIAGETTLLQGAPPPRWPLPAPGAPVLSRPAALMGVINRTPDSFSDGGRWDDAATALRGARSMAAAGATWIDVGGESSRPGAEPVPTPVELERVVPVIAAISRAGLDVAISVDTCKAAVAAAAVEAGAAMVNDITAGGDPELLAVVAERGVALCLMHMQGTPRTMQRDPRYSDPVDEVIAFLARRMAAAVASGVREEALVVDPGIGFGKRPEHNVALLRALPRIGGELGRPLLVGVSRKSLVAALLGRDLPPGERDHASHVLHAQLAPHCSLLRVHDVAGARDACRLSLAIGGPP